MSRLLPAPRTLRTALLLLLALGTTPALAQQGGNPGRPQLTPAQQQKLFPEWRSIDQQSVRARLVILQAQERCLTAATSLQALRACQRQEREALMQQRQQHRQALTALFNRNGIPLPPRPPRRLTPWNGGGPGEGGQGGGGTSI